jgi:hypothetical protein
MNHAAVELRRKSDAARERLGRQLAGMEGHLERTHAPGQWTTREVLCHLLGEPGTRLVGLLERFSATDPPLVEITPGLVTVTAERRGMTLAALLDALDAQRAAVLGYLDTRDGRPGPQGAHPRLRPDPGHRRGHAAGLRWRHVRHALGRTRGPDRSDPAGGGPVGGGVQ